MKGGDAFILGTAQAVGEHACTESLMCHHLRLGTILHASLVLVKEEVIEEAVCGQGALVMELLAS